MNIGDKLTGPQLDELPVGSVVVHDEPEHQCFNTVTRTATGHAWYGQSCSGGELTEYPSGRIYVDGWTLVHLPAPVVPKVGDVVETEAEFRALPVGCVMVDPTDPDPESRPAVKVRADTWMYHDGDGVDLVDSADLDDIAHTVVYLPSADTGAGRTAA